MCMRWGFSSCLIKPGYIQINTSSLDSTIRYGHGELSLSKKIKLVVLFPLKSQLKHCFPTCLKNQNHLLTLTIFKPWNIWMRQKGRREGWGDSSQRKWKLMEMGAGMAFFDDRHIFTSQVFQKVVKIATNLNSWRIYIVSILVKKNKGVNPPGNIVGFVPHSSLLVENNPSWHSCSSSSTHFYFSGFLFLSPHLMLNLLLCYLFLSSPKKQNA